MRIVAFSDIHNTIEDYVWAFKKELHGDILIFAGDVGGRTSLRELETFILHTYRLPFKHKIFIPGNHDACFDYADSKALELLRPHWEIITPNLTRAFRNRNVVIKSQEGDTLTLVNIAGLSYTPPFRDWYFMADEEILEKHANNNLKCLTKDDFKLSNTQCPPTVEVLNIFVSHGPPKGILDYVPGTQEHVGSESLLKVIEREKPDYCFVGHIHEGYGSYEKDGIKYFNVSAVDVKIRTFNPPTVVSIGN